MQEGFVDTAQLWKEKKKGTPKGTISKISRHVIDTKNAREWTYHQQVPIAVTTHITASSTNASSKYPTRPSVSVLCIVTYEHWGEGRTIQREKSTLVIMWGEWNEYPVWYHKAPKYTPIERAAILLSTLYMSCCLRDQRCVSAIPNLPKVSRRMYVRFA